MQSLDPVLCIIIYSKLDISAVLSEPLHLTFRPSRAEAVIIFFDIFLFSLLPGWPSVASSSHQSSCLPTLFKHRYIWKMFLSPVSHSKIRSSKPSSFFTRKLKWRLQKTTQTLQCRIQLLGDVLFTREHFQIPFIKSETDVWRIILLKAFHFVSYHISKYNIESKSCALLQ